MNHAKRNPGIPKRPNPQKNAKVVLGLQRKCSRFGEEDDMPQRFFGDIGPCSL